MGTVMAAAENVSSTGAHALTLASSAGRGWEGFGAALLRISAGRNEVAARPRHVVGVHLGAPVRAHCRCDGRRTTSIQSHGDANVLPAELDGNWTDDADCTILRVSFNERFVQATADALGLAPDRARIYPRFQLRDKRVEHLAGALGAELEADDTSNALYAESLCTALVVRLLTLGPETVDQRRTLAPPVARRVMDFIESQLGERLVLSDIAAVAGISVPHLKVLFRATTGMPVHRYVIQRRTERAKSLLMQGELSAAQVALETGFAHQSHMAHWMKRILGVSPSKVVKVRGDQVRLVVAESEVGAVRQA